MSALEDLEREMERQRRSLVAVENHATRSMLAAYEAIRRRLREQLAWLQADIAIARRSGQELHPGWLNQQARYHHLLDDFETGLQTFALQTAGATVSAQQEAAQLAIENAPRAAIVSLGPAPWAARDRLAAAFGRPDQAAVHALIARLADDQPLGLLLNDLAPTGVERVRAALAFGVSAGRGPRAIAAELRQEADVPLDRALLVARDQTIKAYRAATSDQFQRSKVVREWEWHATLSERTCPVCIAMHGTRHPVTEPLESHPACRCTQIPVTVSWAELGIPGVPDDRPVTVSGPVLFSRLPAGEQRSILGAGKYALYRSGDLELPDLVRRTQSPLWGPGLREAALRELPAAA